MSDITLYNTLRKIPDVSDDEAASAVADVASTKEVATKADLEKLETRLIAEMYRINNRTNYWVLGVGIAIIITFFMK